MDEKKEAEDEDASVPTEEGGAQSAQVDVGSEEGKPSEEGKLSEAVKEISENEIDAPPPTTSQSPLSISPVEEQAPVGEIAQRSNHRKFLLAIPALTVLAVAGVVLFYAITWNDNPRNKSEGRLESRSGRSVHSRDEPKPQSRKEMERSSRQLPSQFEQPKARQFIPLPPKLSSPQIPEDFDAEDEEGTTNVTNEDIVIREDVKESLPWPIYDDNLTDDYLDEPLVKINSVRLKRVPKHPFVIDLVETPLNFSEANTYCKRHDSYLMLLNSQDEESYFTQVVVRNEMFHSKCFTSFLGYRKILRRNIKVNGTNVATFDDPLSKLSGIWLAESEEDEYDSDCAILRHNVEKNEFGLVRSSCNATTNCYLCETPRGCRHPSCYFWHYKMNETSNYEDAKYRCIHEKDAKLAQIRNKAMLESLKNQLNASSPTSLFSMYSEEACQSGYYVDKVELNLGLMDFESSEEKPISYLSSEILLAKGKKKNEHCLAVSKKHAYRWILVPCQQKTCFFCRYDQL